MQSYEVLKALHLIAIICWFAGLFYLPRLFVYHAELNQNGAPNKAAADMLSTMERKLYTYIMQPAMLATWAFGIALILHTPEWLQSGGWLHAKIFLVVLLTSYHHSLKSFHKKLAAGTNTKSAKFFRWYNEIPTVLLLAIVFLAVLKPF